MKTTVPIYIFLAWIIVFLGSCKTSQSRGKGPGKDYFNNNFKCTEGMLPYENRQDYLSFYREYRKKAFQNTSNKEVFAVITGDSTTALFYQERLNKYVPGIEIINRGIGGDTTAMLLQRLDEDIIAIKPKVIIIEIGGNDILAGRCLSSILKNTDKIIKHLREKLPTAEIIIVSIPPVVTWKANSITPFYNRQLEYLTENYSRVHFMDLWPILSEQERPLLKKDYHLFLPGGKLDHVHLNEGGYREWGKLIESALKKVPKKK